MKKILKSVISLVIACSMALSLGAMTGCDMLLGGNNSSTPTDSFSSTNPVVPEDSSSSANPVDPEDSSSSTNPVDPEDPVVPSGPFEYDSYLIKHAEGTATTYVFEAECTDLRGKAGPGWSGQTEGSGMAIGGISGMSNDGGLSYLAAMGISVNFLVVCDRDVEDATLKMRVGAEFINMVLNPNNYSIRVDYATADDLKPTEEGGALGNWDNFFLNFDFEGADMEDLRDTYYVSKWDCGQISIDAEGESEAKGFDDYVITTKLKLKKGVNSISFITNNATEGLGGTLAAVSPVFDAIKITTTAQLGMYGQQNNGYGTNGCKISD